MEITWYTILSLCVFLILWLRWLPGSSVSFTVWSVWCFQIDTRLINLIFFLCVPNIIFFLLILQDGIFDACSAGCAVVHHRCPFVCLLPLYSPHVLCIGTWGANSIVPYFCSLKCESQSHLSNLP